MKTKKMENINLAVSTEDVQMNQRTLNINREKVRKFVEDFNKLFVELEVCFQQVKPANGNQHRKKKLPLLIAKAINSLPHKSFRFCSPMLRISP